MKKILQNKWIHHTQSGKPISKKQLKTLHKHILDPVHKITTEEIRNEILNEPKPKRYSFDDLHIGILGKRALKTRLIARPKNLTNDEWYKFAGEIIKLLNNKENKS